MNQKTGKTHQKSMKTPKKQGQIGKKHPIFMPGEGHSCLLIRRSP
jgi:hypothetical protein